MTIPLPAALDELAGLNGCGGSDHRDQFAMPLHLHPDDAEAGFRAVEGHPLDQSRKRFATVVLVGGVGFEAHAASMRDGRQESK